MSEAIDRPDPSFALFVVGYFAIFVVRWALLPADDRAMGVLAELIPLFIVGVPDVVLGSLAVLIVRPALRWRIPTYAAFLMLIAVKMYWFGEADFRTLELAMNGHTPWGYVARLVLLATVFLSLAGLAKTLDKPASAR